MTDRRAIGDAVGVMTAELGATPHDAESAWQAYLRFTACRFATPSTADADGLLFQFGTFEFGGPPAFTLDMCRQFEVVDRDGEFVRFIQIHCELQYAPTPELGALGSFSSWFFHDSGEELAAWTRAVRANPIWNVLGTNPPSSIRVWEDDAC